MILKSKEKATSRELRATSTSRLHSCLLACGLLLAAISIQSTCKYGFKDAAPIPIEVKTFRVNYFENRADYKNPQLSPQITEKLKQKIISTTRLRLVLFAVMPVVLV